MAVDQVAETAGQAPGPQNGAAPTSIIDTGAPGGFGGLDDFLEGGGGFGGDIMDTGPMPIENDPMMYNDPMMDAGFPEMDGFLEGPMD